MFRRPLPRNGRRLAVESESDTDSGVLTLVRRHWLSLVLIVGVWAALRAVFFQGFEGYDDISYVRYASQFGFPVDVFEVRFLYNSLLAASIRLFGFSEFACAVPTLIASLVILFCSWLVALRLAGPNAALWAGMAAAFIGLDVNNSTVPMVNTVAAAFASAGIAIAVLPRTVFRQIATGALMGLAINAHMATAFFFLPFLIGYLLFADRGQRIVQTSTMLASVLVTFAVTEASLGMIYAGNPLIRFELVQSTHLAVQHYEISPTLNDGSWNPDWFTWPLKSLIVTKEFGAILSLLLAAVLLLRKRLTRTQWFLVSVTAGGWLYICFGSQLPHRYQPIDHQTRYWYPLVMPLAALFGILAAQIASRGPRTTFCGLCLLPLPVLMLASGSWGQNVEVSRELLAHAKSHPKVRFVTDQYTWEEIDALSRFEPPTNICVLAQADNPASYPGPPCPHDIARAENVEALINIMHLERPRSGAFRELLNELPSRTAVSDPALRTIARWLPSSMRDDQKWIRRPAAWIGRRASSINAAPETHPGKVAQQ